VGGKTDDCFYTSKNAFQVELPFLCKNQSEFNKLYEKHPRTIILLPWVNAAYREFKDFAAEVLTNLAIFMKTFFNV
jgi:hypothetical protein